jgi:hypothetical protein
VKKLSIGQKKALSEFLNTTAAAWFAAGVIAPLFAAPKTSEELTLSIILGAISAIAFLFGSLIMVKEVNL